MRAGRMIAAAVLGFVFFLFVAIDLVLFGIVPLNSPLVTILPLAGVAVGGVVVALVAARPDRSFDEPPPPPPPPPPAPAAPST